MSTATQQDLRFNGSDYDPARDNARLGAQFARVMDYMSDGEFHTLREISAATGDPEASVSAQIRHAKKKRFGSHVVQKQHRGNGLFAYRIVQGAPA